MLEVQPELAFGSWNRRCSARWKQFLQRRLAFGGLFGAAPLLSILRWTASLSYRLVAVQHHGWGHLIEQSVDGAAIGHLAAGQRKGKRAAEAIGQARELLWFARA